MKTQINGDHIDFTPQPDDSAVDVIRETCGLTGTKLVCGSGACGACTVLVDGIPMTSCLLPVLPMQIAVPPILIWKSAFTPWSPS